MITTTITTTTADFGAHIGVIGILSILLLITFLIFEDISTVAIKGGDIKGENCKTKNYVFFKRFINLSKIFTMPLIYVFLSIILYRIILIF